MTTRTIARFPSEALPDSMHRAAVAVSAAMGIPPECVAAPMLGALSCSATGRHAVRFRGDDVGLNLVAVLLSDTGTGAASPATRFLHVVAGLPALERDVDFAPLVERFAAVLGRIRRSIPSTLALDQDAQAELGEWQKLCIGRARRASGELSEHVAETPRIVAKLAGLFALVDREPNVTARHVLSAVRIARCGISHFEAQA